MCFWAVIMLQYMQWPHCLAVDSWEWEEKSLSLGESLVIMSAVPLWLVISYSLYKNCTVGSDP